MTPQALKSARSSLGLAQKQLAEALRVARNRIARYEGKKYPMPAYVELALEMLLSRNVAVRPS